MYENEIYSEENATRSEASPYFDYTANSAEELAGRAESAKPKKEKKKRQPREKGGTPRKVAVSIGLGLCFGIFAGLGFYAVQLGMGQLNQTGGSGNVVYELPSDIVRVPSGGENQEVTTRHITYVQEDISDMVEEVMPAMVSIVNNYMTTGYFWGQQYSKPGVGSGSGIIVGETEDELLIATNYHVVEDSTNLEVTFIDNSTAQAVIKGVDADMDLAVVAVAISGLTEETHNAITVAQLGDSDHLRLGEPVVAIGNALGYGQSVTNGIVSALNREMTTEDGYTGIYIQTNAAINHGNSGGALLNIEGEVIGINAARIDGSFVEGMGYAIPISSAGPILADLMEHRTRAEKVEESEIGYMGISMQAVTDEYANMFDMPKGVFVREVTEGSAAERAGILKGDIIVKFDGQRISSTLSLQETLQYFRVGDTAVVTVKRAVNGEYETLDLEITLGRRPVD